MSEKPPDYYRRIAVNLVLWGVLLLSVAYFDWLLIAVVIYFAAYAIIMGAVSVLWDISGFINYFINKHSKKEN